MLVFVELFFSLMCTSIHSMQHLSCCCPNILRFQPLWSSRTVPDEILSSLDEFSIITGLQWSLTLWHFLNQACQSHIFIVVMCSSFMLGAWIICLWSSVRVHLSSWGSYSKLSIFNQSCEIWVYIYFEGIHRLFRLEHFNIDVILEYGSKVHYLLYLYLGFLYPHVKICNYECKFLFLWIIGLTINSSKCTNKNENDLGEWPMQCTFSSYWQFVDEVLMNVNYHFWEITWQLWWYQLQSEHGTWLLSNCSVQWHFSDFQYSYRNVFFLSR